MKSLLPVTPEMAGHIETMKAWKAPSKRAEQRRTILVSLWGGSTVAEAATLAGVDAAAVHKAVGLLVLGGADMVRGGARRANFAGPTKKLCLTMPETLVVALDRAAKKRGVSKSELIRTAVEKELGLK